jgi:hypothetical protein
LRGCAEFSNSATTASNLFTIKKSQETIGGAWLLALTLLPSCSLLIADPQQARKLSLREIQFLPKETAI